MTSAGTVNCPHCGAATTVGAAFCASCGKAMPVMGASAVGPRVVSGSEFAATAAGQQLQSDELHKQARKASGALLAVAIIATIFTGVLVAVANSANTIQIPEVKITLVAMGVVALLFWGLWAWSRSQPLPAAIVGLVIYATLVVINVVTHFAAWGSTDSTERPRGSPIGLVDIIILVVLARAITAGVKYRKLSEQRITAPAR